MRAKGVVRWAVSVGLLACLGEYRLSAAGGGAGAGAGASTLEGLGDEEWSLATPHYRLALEAWERAASHASRLRDRAALDRSRAERGRLSVLLRDPRLLEILRGEAGSSLKPGLPVSPPPLLVTAASAPPAARLESLTRFLALAARRYAQLPRREDRDLVLLAEAEAMAHRVQGDLHLARADDAFRKALEAAGASGGEPALALERGRLCYKLRDFAGAKAAAAEDGAELKALPREAVIEHLARLRDIALFDGDAARVGALREEIRRRSGKEEETARPVARFQSLIVGSPVDIAETLGTLLDLSSRNRLPPREASLAALLAGSAAVELGEYALAEEVLRGGAGGDDAWMRASIEARLGMACGQLGDYEASVEALEEARSAAAGLSGTEAFRARVAVNLSRSLLGLGETERARAEALDVLRLRELPADLRIRARILVGDVLYEEARDSPSPALLQDLEGAYQAASRDLEAARGKEPALDAAELDAILAINLGNLARLRALGAKGEEAAQLRKQAIALEDRALRAADGAKHLPLAAAASANLGELYLEGGDLRAARSFIEWALSRAAEERLFETEWRCHWYRGRLAEAEGDARAADDAYATAAAIIESYRSRILDAEKKGGFLTDKLAFYRDVVRRALRKGRPDLALDAAERAKARALVDSLGWRFIALADPRDTELYREYVSLLARSERSRQGAATSLLGVQAKGLGYEDLRSRLLGLKERLTRDPECGAALRALIDGDPSDAAAILRDLPERSTLVEYFSLGDSLVALTAAGGRVDATELPVASRDLDSLVTAFVRSGAADVALARRLHLLLVAPFEERIAGERLAIVPFGPLHQLPFETLRDDKGLLVARWDITYLPSASVLKHLKRRDPPRGSSLSLLAVVDPDTDYNRDGKPDMPPLPHAREEVAGFAPSFGERSILLGAGALKLACQRDASRYDVIHYACHGEFYPARPWDSTLFLAPGVVDGVRDDGRLRASEVYTIDLRKSRLVALSGCETGRSRVGPGDDAVSLGTAFLHSGASSLLVSLWKVEDQATAALMKSFYEKWVRQGKDKGRALRESKLELAASRFPQPRQWGAFVLMGEP